MDQEVREVLEYQTILEDLFTSLVKMLIRGYELLYNRDSGWGTPTVLQTVWQLDLELVILA